jgi:archaellum component FlaD/FlaE
VEHYEDVGWISPAVTRRLLDLVAVAGVDDDDGSGRRREPTAADHATSYGYVRVLRRLSEG